MSEALKPPVGSSNKDFVPHKQGAFAAICADVYVKTDDNPFFGKKGLSGKVDTNEKRTRAHIVFLTSDMVDVAGQMRPAYVAAKHSFTWGTMEYPSNLRKFVRSWFPTATDKQIEDMDILRLIGKTAYITVGHTVKGENTYANITAVMPLPAGLSTPAIPADFKRHDEKEVQPAPNVNPNPVQFRPDHPPVGNIPAGPAYQKDPWADVPPPTEEPPYRVPGGSGIGDPSPF